MRLVAALMLLAYSPAIASDLSDMRLADLIDECITAQDAGEESKSFAKELFEREKFHLGEVNRARGKQCLETAFGTEFNFFGGRFRSEELIRQKEELIRQKEQAAKLKEELRQEAAALAAKKERQRRDEVNRQLVDICVAEYFEDRFRALTARPCLDVFYAIGLPQR